MNPTLSGQITLSGTGAQSYYVGITPIDITFYSGARSSTVETVGYLNVGHADDSYQFVIPHKDGKSQIIQNKCIYAYNSAGTKVLDATYTGASGGYINFNVTTSNPNYPIQLVMRY